MKQNFFTVLFFLIFMGVFGYFYGGEYRDFYTQQKIYTQQQYILEEALEIFETDSIEFLEYVTLEKTPNKELLDIIVQKIDTAKEKVYLEVYIFTEKRIFQALKKAHERGIDVQVILEKNPYRAPGLNDNRYNALEQAGILVAWSSSDNYALNHTKMLLIDNEAIISTGNISYSTFIKNRDFFVFIEDADILSTLEDVFHGDIRGQKNIPYHKNIVLSPSYSRQKLTQLILSAETSIDMYFQYLKDTELLEHVKYQASQGVKIRMILDDDYYGEYSSEIAELQSYGIEIHKYHSSVMHAKAMLFDRKVLFIGSINFSSYSLDKNREVGILIRNANIIQDFQEVFDSDF